MSKPPPPQGFDIRFMIVGYCYDLWAADTKCLIVFHMLYIVLQIMHWCEIFT